ncbi:MAG: hypothetical protein MUF43_02280 [Flavobacterium sp.]|nr:hypothetical protein [Flavobacterium sp.]
MAKVKDQEFNVEMQIRAIELLKESFNVPAVSNIAITTINLNIRIESKADAANKLVFVIVHVEIGNEDHSIVLGEISVSCIFEIINFDEVIRIEENGKFDIPPRLIETLNVVSISTTRGVMFSTFKGTFLHGAVLPILDPKQFTTNIQKV